MLLPQASLSVSQCRLSGFSSGLVLRPGVASYKSSDAGSQRKDGWPQPETALVQFAGKTGKAGKLGKKDKLPGWIRGLIWSGIALTGFGTLKPHLPELSLSESPQVAVSDAPVNEVTPSESGRHRSDGSILYTGGGESRALQALMKTARPQDVFALNGKYQRPLLIHPSQAKSLGMTDWTPMPFGLKPVLLDVDYTGSYALSPLDPLMQSRFQEATEALVRLHTVEGLLSLSPEQFQAEWARQYQDTLVQGALNPVIHQRVTQGLERSPLFSWRMEPDSNGEPDAIRQVQHLKDIQDRIVRQLRGIQEDEAVAPIQFKLNDVRVRLLDPLLPEPAQNSAQMPVQLNITPRR